MRMMKNEVWVKFSECVVPCSSEFFSSSRLLCGNRTFNANLKLGLNIKGGTQLRAFENGTGDHIRSKKN